VIAVGKNGTGIDKFDVELSGIDPMSDRSQSDSNL